MIPTLHSISLSHQGPVRKLKLIEQGVTISTKLNDLNADKNPSPAVTEPKHSTREFTADPSYTPIPMAT